MLKKITYIALAVALVGGCGTRQLSAEGIDAVFSEKKFTLSDGRVISCVIAYDDSGIPMMSCDWTRR